MLLATKLLFQVSEESAGILREDLTSSSPTDEVELVIRLEIQYQC